jgi:hypothetical protein
MDKMSVYMYLSCKHLCEHIHRNSMYSSVNEYILPTDECLDLLDHAAPDYDL